MHPCIMVGRRKERRVSVSGSVPSRLLVISVNESVDKQVSCERGHGV